MLKTSAGVIAMALVVALIDEATSPTASNLLATATLIASICTGIAAIITASRAKAIHALVNGNATKSFDQIVALEHKLSEMHNQLLVLQEKRVADAKEGAASDGKPLPVVIVERRTP